MYLYVTVKNILQAANNYLKCYHKTAHNYLVLHIQTNNKYSYKRLLIFKPKKLK